LDIPGIPQGDFRAPQIIAEVGTGHQGDLEKARALIEAAAQAGVEVVKFQHVLAREILHPRTGEVSLPGGPTSLYEVFEDLERPIDFYRTLQKMCRANGVQFLCTPFGIESAADLINLGQSWFKIASPELNHHELLRFLSRPDFRLLLSTGVSTLADIDETLRLVAEGGAEVALLHCVTAYPAPEEDYNLRVLVHLQGIFGVPVGVSDHSQDPLLVPALAGIFDAPWVEKHFTLSHADGGLDDLIALEPSNLSTLVRKLRSWNGMKKSRVLEEIVHIYGETKVLGVLGTGAKALASSEKDNYGRTNRSIHALIDLYPGTILSPENVAVLRTEKILKPGIHPRYLSMMYGKTITRRVVAGNGIDFLDII